MPTKLIGKGGEGREDEKRIFPELALGGKRGEGEKKRGTCWLGEGLPGRGVRISLHGAQRKEKRGGKKENHS